MFRFLSPFSLCNPNPHSLVCFILSAFSALKYWAFSCQILPIHSDEEMFHFGSATVMAYVQLERPLSYQNVQGCLFFFLSLPTFTAFENNHFVLQNFPFSFLWENFQLSFCYCFTLSSATTSTTTCSSSATIYAVATTSTNTWGFFCSLVQCIIVLCISGIFFFIFSASFTLPPLASTLLLSPIPFKILSFFQSEFFFFFFTKCFLT